METLLTTDPSRAAHLLREGGLVAFPTETVYGLGARADQAAAVERIFEAKQRPADNPLIVHVADPEDVTMVAAIIPDIARRLMQAFWPGPLTLILPARSGVPRVVTAGLDTVGVRMPDHPVALQLLSEVGAPVAAPSANRSGRPSPTTWEAVSEDLDGRVEAILQGDPATVGLESTVVDCTGPEPVILRPGAVSLEALRSIVPSARERDASSDAVQRSPGTRHRHYRPDAVVRWIGPFDGGAGPFPAPPGESAYIGLGLPPSGYARIRQVQDLEAYAVALFRFFRDCEQAGIKEIHCERVPLTGIGRALTDRIDRAAETDAPSE